MAEHKHQISKERRERFIWGPDDMAVDKPAEEQKGRITKAKISLRVSIFDWSNPARLKELLDYLQKHPGTIDEVALFTIISGSPLPLPKLQEHAHLLANVLPKFKALGLSAGINHLATVGHYDENLAHSLNEPWQHLVDISGSVSLGCLCASDVNVQNYVRQSYIALAEARPDFIWFDDDLRLEPHGNKVQYPCFCNGCMATFSKETGRTWTREVLRQAFRSGSLTEHLALRRQWLEHNRQYAARLLAIMRAAVDSVNPDLTLGFMTVEGSYSAYGMLDWANALKTRKGKPAMCRPGGGYYEDRIPVEVLAKAHWTGRQVTFLPEEVTDIQYELENFPYQTLRKSRTMTMDEIGMAIAIGCTGAALNIMGLTQDPIGEFLPILDAVRANRKFFDRAAAAFGRSQNKGFWPGYTLDHSAALNPREDWFNKTPLWGVDFAQFTELAEIGLPMAYSQESSALAVLSKTSVLDLPRPALMKAFSGGVMLDGPALAELQELGLGEYAGFRVSGKRELDMFEAFTNDEINGRFAGWWRDCHPTFFPDPAYLVQPLPGASTPWRGSGARVLAEIVDFEGVSSGPCAGLFENSLGGRVAVMGYYPWVMVHTLAKTEQMKTLFRWLSRDTLPAYIASYARVAVWCRTDAAGKPAFMLINASLDDFEDLALHALTGGEHVALVHMDGSQELLAPQGKDGPYSRYVLPQLKAWDMALLVLA